MDQDRTGAPEHVGPERRDQRSDACAAVDATGFLLACSTQPSSTVVRRLEEIHANRNIVTRYWDSIEIEKRLDTPSTFPLISILLPKSSAAMPWKIYNSTRPSFWAANYKDYFLYLASRTSNLFPKLRDVEGIVARLESIKRVVAACWKRPLRSRKEWRRRVAAISELSVLIAGRRCFCASSL